MTVIKTECDDQMVPLGTIEILSSDAGATVIDTQKVLPDFESLFTATCDLQGTTELLFPSETSDDHCGLKTPDSGFCDMDTQALCTEEALKLIDLEQTIASDDMSFYGNLNYYYPEKMEKDPAMPNYYNEQSQQQQAYGAIYQEEQTQPETEADLEALRREIEYTCAHLQITPDPYSWTPDMTQRWAKYQLEQYVHLPAILPDQFYIDGTSLCMLTKEDLCARFPEHGQYLFPQLDIWKMCSVYSMQANSLVYQEEPAYTIQDLDKVVLPCKAPTAIPTPVITALPTSIPTPILQPQTCQTMSPSQSVDSLDSPNSSLSSWSSVGSISSADSRTNSPHSRDTFKYQSRPSGKHTIHLWQFLKELLLEPQSFSNCIKWIDQRKGIFKIEDSSRVARLWGKRKNRPAMNYDKLSRSIRQYYKKGIIKKTEHSKRLVYQFCPQYL